MNIQPCGVENEQADAGQDGRTCLLARPNSQPRTGDRINSIFLLYIADHEQEFILVGQQSARKNYMVTAMTVPIRTNGHLANYGYYTIYTVYYY